MTGGGRVKVSSMQVTHGFELHCNASTGPNNLQINWGNSNSFHLDKVTSAYCYDDPRIAPRPAPADFDTYVGSGTGSYNGVAGAVATWTFTDAGDPGVKDFARYEIRSCSTCPIVLSISGYLVKGNHQAHRDLRPIMVSTSEYQANGNRQDMKISGP